MTETGGPLAGLKVIELAGIGPGPHAAMLLADLGADVVRIQREGELRSDPSLRGRTIVEADLKSAAGVQTVLSLADRADVFIEGFRPGVAERLGVGPDTVLERNPRIVYGRMTGWGQYGPLAHSAGHDINYISISGILNSLGRAGEAPLAPVNLLGDFGGGSMFLLFGVLAAVYESQGSGRGQVVDVAMVDGAIALSQLIWAMRGAKMWSDERGTNLLDSGAPFYDVYETSDGRYMAVGALEPQFYAELLRGLGLDAESLPPQLDPRSWPRLREVFTARFRERTRSAWTAEFEGRDACVTPVLTFSEAPEHPHIAARGSLTSTGGVIQHAPAPRFSRSVPALRRVPSAASDPSTVWS